MADQLFVPPDDQGTLATLISVTGVVLSQEAFDSCEAGIALPSGRMIILRENVPDPNNDVEAVKIYNANRTLIATNTSLVIPNFWNFSPVAPYGPNKFLVAQVDETQTFNTVVRVISDAGVVGPESWTLNPSNGFGGLATNVMGASPDLSTLYFGPDGFYTAEIYRWDLVNNVQLSSLYSPAGTTRLGDDLLVLSNGTIVVGWRNVAAVAQWQLRGFNPAGGVLFAYDWDFQTEPRLALAPDELSVWAMGFNAGATKNLFRQIRLSDGAILTSFDLNNQNVDPGGPSQCCPLILLSGSTPPIVPSAGCPTGLPLSSVSGEPGCPTGV